MNQLPTAEAIATKWALDDGDLLHDAAIEAMKEFAKLHVEAALKAAADKAIYTYRLKEGAGSSFHFVATKESIEKAYPLENIK